jgi:futalosine hydrolase
VIEKGVLKSIFDLRLAAAGKAPFSNGWLINQSAFLKKTKLKKVTGISVNEITTSPKKQRLYREKFHPTLESMEGAALHYVCLQEKIPFIQLRSVSNYIGERNKKKWNLKESIINLNKELITLLHQL